jgi:hypothetical protein
MTTLAAIALESRLVFMQMLNDKHNTDIDNEKHQIIDSKITKLITTMNLISTPRLGDIDEKEHRVFRFAVLKESFSFTELKEKRELGSFQTSCRYAQFKLWKLVRERGEQQEKE